MIFMLTFWIRENFLVDRNQFQTSLHNEENLLASLDSWISHTLEDAPVKLTLFCPWTEFLLLESGVDWKRRKVLSFLCAQFPPFVFVSNPSPFLPHALKISYLHTAKQVSKILSQGKERRAMEEKKGEMMETL